MVALSLINAARPMDLVRAHSCHGYWTAVCHFVAAPRAQNVAAFVCPGFFGRAVGGDVNIGEQLPPLRIAGLVLIVLGVVLVGQTA